MVDPAPSLQATLARLETLLAESGTGRSQLLRPAELALATALPEETIRTLLRGEEVPSDTVNERVRSRIKALADAHMARTNKPMSELATGISQQLGVSTFWARQVCTGEKVPSVAFLHGLVGFFGKSQYGEAFFTAPAADALDRALQPVLATLEPAAANQTRAGEAAATAGTEHDDVRGIALRQARNLPPERWKVLNATLTALLLLDDGEEDL